MYLMKPNGEALAEEHATLLGAMANPARLSVLALVSQREWTVNELANAVNLSQSALSQHLAKLRERGMVDTRRDAQSIYYSCRSPAVATILNALKEIAEPTTALRTASK